MLKFNSKGLLEPDMEIASSIAELQFYFVDSFENEQRKEIFDCYKKYIEDLKRVCNHHSIKQWIDGSFVTKTTKPGDIDLISFIPHQLIDANEAAFEKFKYPNSLINYQVDAYLIKVYPETHSSHFLYNSDRVYWLNQFSKTKRNRLGNRYPKGFLEINL